MRNRRLRLTLLGGFDLRVGAQKLVFPTRKAEALLAYLALRPGQAQSRDVLSGLLWASSPAEQARHSVRQALSILRKHIPVPEPLLIIEGQTIALSPQIADIDVVEFRALVGRDTPTAANRALELYRGDLLAGMNVREEPFEEWLRTERARLRDIAFDVLLRLLEHHTKVGNVEAAIRAGTRLLALDPFREDVHRAMMRLYARAGRRGDALRQYQSCVTVLQRELGVEPSSETREVYREMLPERRSGPWVVAHPAEKRPRGPRAGLSGDPAPTPLVGRVSELAELNHAMTAAWRGRGQIAMIVGSAGIGKTRVIEDVASRALRRGGRVLAARAFETERPLPFAPWVDILRAALRIYDEGGVRSPNLVWRAELGKLLPELGEPGSAPPTGNSLRLFEAVAHIVRDIASRWPLVLILEDLHWADEMSVRLFTFLANRIEACPLLAVATIRDEELAEAPLLRRFLQAADASAHVHRLELPPLSRDETAVLVRALAPRRIEAPAAVDLAEQVWFLSEGNPFLIVEIMRTPEIEETRTVSARLPLPERVREVVAARLARLGEPAQRLIAVAAAVGRELEFGLLQRAAGLDDAAAAEGVEQLVRRRIIQPVGERFDFAHHTIRGVVYDGLSSHRRKELHHRVALAMEDLYAQDLEPYYLALARHFSEAEIWHPAIGYLWQAGLQAGDRSAHREAVLLFTQALDMVTRLPKAGPALGHAVDLHLAIGESLLLSGEPSSALGHIREAELLASSTGDRWRSAWVLAAFSEYFRTIGEHDRAIGAARRAQVIATALGDVTLERQLRLQLARAHHAVGEYRGAALLLAENVGDADASAEPGTSEASLLGALMQYRNTAAVVSAASRTWLVWCLAEMGRLAEALQHGWEGLRAGAASSATRAVPLLLAHLGLGHALLRKGDVKDAIALLEPCREMRERGGPVDGVPLFVDSLLGWAYRAAGRLAEATTLAAAAVDEAGAMRIVDSQSLRVTILGQALLEEGRTDEARERALRALELARTHKERGHEAYALKLVADILAHGTDADLEGAEASYQQAYRLASELGMHPLAAVCHVGLANVYVRTDKAQLAREHRAHALTMCRAMGMTVDLGPAEIQ